MKEKDLLVTKTEELFETTDKMLKEMFFASGIELEDMFTMDEEEYSAVKKCFEMWKMCKEYSVEMAKRLDKINDIDEKLDMVVKQLREKK